MSLQCGWHARVTVGVTAHVLLWMRVCIWVHIHVHKSESVCLCTRVHGSNTQDTVCASQCQV